jgi:type II secretory pathway component PulC
VPAADDLSVLWPDVRGASAASPQRSSQTAGSPVPVSDGETVTFKIKGVIASLSGASSVVFVQSSSGDLMIRPGEVADGWKLIRVKGSTATFAKEGREVTLSLAKREYDAGGGIASSSAVSRPSQLPPRAVRFAMASSQPPGPNPRPSDSSNVTAASTPVSPPAAVDVTDNKTVAVPRDVVNMALTNPGVAMQGLQLAPLMSNGQMQGVTIANVAAGSLAAPYLAPGDQILAVNGTPINSIASAMNIYQQLLSSGSTSVTVTMQRGGQRQNVVYSVQ